MNAREVITDRNEIRCRSLHDARETWTVYMGDLANEKRPRALVVLVCNTCGESRYNDLEVPR